MPTHHKLILGDCASMSELADGSVHLMVTSPPYFNAPFDYDYEGALMRLLQFSRACYIRLK